MLKMNVLISKLRMLEKVSVRESDHRFLNVYEAVVQSDGFVVLIIQEVGVIVQSYVLKNFYISKVVLRGNF